MNAPEKTITLAEEVVAWVASDHAKEIIRNKAACACGWEGTAGEVLVDPLAPIPNQMWCPRCMTDQLKLS